MDNRANNGGHSTAGKAGRPSQRDELKAIDLASPHIESAFRTIAEIMINPDENSKDRITASKILIEYGCGKPKETVDQNVNINNFELKDIIKFKE
jgi:phage tail sheath protein FI